MKPENARRLGVGPHGLADDRPELAAASAISSGPAAAPTRFRRRLARARPSAGHGAAGAVAARRPAGGLA